MIVCKVCGTENEQGAGFCGSCGTFLEWNSEPVPKDEPIPPAPLPDVTIPAPPEPDPTPPPDPRPREELPGQLTCPACGQVNEATRVYCRRCATELAPAAPTLEPIPPAPPRVRSGPPLALIGGIAAVVILLAVGAFVLLPKGTAAPSSASTASIPSSNPSGAPSAQPSAPVESPSAEPSEPPASLPPTKDSLTGLVVFSAIKDNKADLWIWDPADDSLRALVTGSGNQTEPAWAPDGSAVVYRAPDGLRMVLANGKPFDPPDFTHHAEDRNPAWSRDGKRVVFASNRAPFTSLNIVARAARDNTADLVVLVSNKAADWDPQFSPDGGSIVFVSTRNGDGKLFLMDANGKNERIVDLGPGYYDDPMFSPDGERLAFTRRDDAKAQKDLWVARVDGSGMRRLTATDANENDLAWSPDGRVIAVARADDAGRIVLVNAETGDEIGDIGVDGAANGHPDWLWPQP